MTLTQAHSGMLCLTHEVTLSLSQTLSCSLIRWTSGELSSFVTSTVRRFSSCTHTVDHSYTHTYTRTIHAHGHVMLPLPNAGSTRDGTTRCFRSCTQPSAPAHAASAPTRSLPLRHTLLPLLHTLLPLLHHSHMHTRCFHCCNSHIHTRCFHSCTHTLTTLTHSHSHFDSSHKYKLTVPLLHSLSWGRARPSGTTTTPEPHTWTSHTPVDRQRLHTDMYH